MNIGVHVSLSILVSLVCMPSSGIARLYESVLMRWMKLEPIIQSEVSQKEKHQYSILTHIYGTLKDGNNNPEYETAKETLMYRRVLWTLWEREKVGRFGRMALKHVKYHV